MKYHIEKKRVLYNTLCGRLSKSLLANLKRLNSYPRHQQCKKCAKVAAEKGLNTG